MIQVNDIPGQNPINEQEIKDRLIAQHKQTEAKKYDFPTEVIELPSKGLLYPQGHPLSSGTIEMKYMTAKEEDILASANLIKQGVVIDKLLESMIITPINYKDLLLGDKNALLFAARVLGYGKDYKAEYTCPNCDEVNHIHIDLSTFKEKPFDESLITPGLNEFTFQLPNSKRTITFSLLTHGKDQQISSELKATQKTGKSTEVTTRLAHVITSVDGIRDIAHIRNFVNNEMFAVDSRALRQEIQRVTPDLDTTVHFECKYCAHQEEITLPMDTEFFWPRV